MLFHPCSTNENLPRKLPLLSLYGLEIKQASSAIFLAVEIDENIFVRSKLP